MKQSKLSNQKLFKKIRQLSNPSKFKIIELTQEKELTITSIAKQVKLAFNKCSNYCTKLEKNELIQKNKKGKNTFVKSKVCILKDSIKFK